MFGHDKTTASSFSPNGVSMLFSTSGSFHVTDIRDGHQEWDSPKTHTARLATFSLDGTRVFSCTSKKNIHTWDAKTGAELSVQKPPATGDSREPILSVVSAFSPDGTLIGSESNGDGIDVWNVRTCAYVGPSLNGHTKGVRSIAFSPDVSRIASGSNDHSICVWDLGTWKMIGEPLRGHKAAIQSISFSPDGNWIVSGSYDCTIRIWDVVTGAIVRPPMTGHTGTATAVVFSPDGAHIVSGSEDCTVRMWDIGPTTDPSAANSVLEIRKRGPWSDYPHLTSELAGRGFALKNGWIVDSEDHLILWVSPAYRHDLHGFGTHILDHEIIELDFSDFKFGQEWHKCRDTVNSE